MTTYELTINSTGEDFFNARRDLINDFIQQITGAEVTTDWRSESHVGRIVSCLNPCNNFESVIASVYFFYTGETKNYGIVAAINCGGLLFVDESMKALYDDFKAANENIKHQEFAAAAEAQRREKEAQKLEKKRQDNMKKLEGMKAQAEKEINALATNREKNITKADEFYYALGWLATHIGTLTAKMPDYLEAAFVKHFGDVEHTVVDSTKVGPAGYTSQWRLSMEASLKKADAIPAMLTDYLSQNGKKLSKTSFVWSLVDDYGFKFGKKQDTLDIMRCVPIEYVPMFNDGMKA
jgi:hypothetical protein